MPTLEVNDEEAKVLAFLAHLGASAFDIPSGPHLMKLREAEQQWGFEVTTEHITAALEKLRQLAEREE